MKPLILGDGLLGTAIRQASGWDYISRKKDGFNAYDFYASDVEGYDVIINCIANTNTYSNKRDDHWYLNYEFVYDLIDACNVHGSKLVQISTDYIYSGSKSGASEDDVPVHCANWYGYTKLLGDGLVQLKAVDYLLIRTSFKPSPFPYDKAIVNQVGNFDYVDLIANTICNMIGKGAEGVYNIGTEPKTIYELAKYSKYKVEPMYEKIHETMPTDITMDCSKMMEFFYDG
jgi:dTDP-4-dehydrorhamnose reductase